MTHIINPTPFKSTIESFLKYLICEQVCLVDAIELLFAQQQALQTLIARTTNTDTLTPIFLHSIMEFQKQQAIEELFNINTQRIQLSVL